MSDFSAYDFEDAAWDEFCRNDDHIVPYPGLQSGDDHYVLGGSLKKRCLELTSITSNTGDGSAARYVDQRSEEGKIATLNKRRNTMLEKDSLTNTPTNTPNGVFSTSSDGNSIKEVSGLASDSTRSSSHDFQSNNTDPNGSEFCADDTILSDKTTPVDDNTFNYPLCDMGYTGSNLDFFENTEDKNSSNFLFYDWPEMGSFGAVDRLLRSCDAEFAPGSSKEDELNWFQSSGNVGGSGDILNSDFKFPSPEPKPVRNISENQDSLKSFSASDSDMTSGPFMHENSSWMSQTSDPYVSFVNGPAITDGIDGFTPKEQINEHKKPCKPQNQSTGKRKECYFGNSSLSYENNLENEVIQQSSGAISHQALPSMEAKQQGQGSVVDHCYSQNPISYVYSDNCRLSDPSVVNTPSSAVKSEANGLTSLSPRDSSQAFSQLTTLAGSEKRENLPNRLGTQYSVNNNIRSANMAVQASMSDPVSVGKPVHFTGDELENHMDFEGVGPMVPEKLGSSKVQDGSTTSSGDDISLEAANILKLQLVMGHLDLRTKLCIRDSLYRLAWSAEQRQNHADLEGGYGDERDVTGVLTAEGKCTSFMDMETDTNPIDRSIAHLLFHRPSESSAVPGQDSLKSPNLVVMAEDMVTHQETVSEIGKNV